MTKLDAKASQSVGARIINLVQRFYALGFLFLIVFVTWRVFRFLIVSLVVSGAAPEQVTGLPARLDEHALRVGRTAFPGMAASPQSRVPLAHYHRLEEWFQPDPRNDCTTSGCHAPLPHFRRKELRAFLNMHATSIHCGVCHFKYEDRPARTVWYSLDSGAETETPALLQAYGIVSESGKSMEKETQQELVRLMQHAADESDNLRSLQTLADHFASVETDGEAFATLVAKTERTIAQHFRGEYGAKIARAAPGGGPLLGHPDTDEAKRKFLSLSPEGQSTASQEALAAVHPLRAARPLTCDDCHGASNLVIDLERLGYPRKRAASLRNPIIVRMVEHIASGRAFHMPEFVQPRKNQSENAKGVAP